MSAEPSREDLRACGTLLNTLNAEHQGAFTHATVLAKLAHPAFEEGRFAELQDRIATIGAWAQRLWQRRPLLLADGRSDEPEALERALGYLDELALRLESVGRELEGALDVVLSHPHDGSAIPEASLVLAAQAWASYAHENELRGAIHQGLTLDDPELADRARRQLPVAEDGLRVLHGLLERLEEPGPPGCELLAEIHRTALHLPGLYGAKTSAVQDLADEIRELRA